MSGAALFALLARGHGLLAALALALVLHPVLSLRHPGRPRPMTRLAAALGAGLLTLNALGGAALYPTYRAQIKPELVHGAVEAALHFERKEHLALLAVCLVQAGAALLLLLPGLAPARRAARALLALGALIGALTGLLGMWVAAVAHPAW
jgi:hypothetical protein